MGKSQNDEKTLIFEHSEKNDGQVVGDICAKFKFENNDPISVPVS